MTLWKRFMGWGIGSTPNFRSRRSASAKTVSPEFRTLTLRLLLSYLGAMTAIIGILTLAVYQAFSYNLYEQVDHQLLTLADAAAHNLPAILSNRRAIEQRTPRPLDGDGDLDIPWQDLQEDEQSIEWFDANYRLLGRAGQMFPAHDVSQHFQFWQGDEVRSVTMPVYASNYASKAEKRIGYVRVTERITDEEDELDRLLMGFGWGGSIAILLIGATGWWLTQRAIQPVEQSFRQLKQFTADASHELRSPLTAIRTDLDAIQSHLEQIPPADVKKLKRMTHATAQMTQLVEDLLLLARTEAAPSQQSKTGLLIPLDELLEDLVESLQTQAEAKAIHLSLDALPDVQIKGDAMQLRRLFANLLENALHYTPAGGTVRLTSTEVDDSHDAITIRVTDTGIGMAPDQLAHVFDRFWRADKARSRREGGSGLGLSIAQAIAQAHGGEITVTSRLGAGSCFQVKLPLA